NPSRYAILPCLHATRSPAMARTPPFAAPAMAPDRDDPIQDLEHPARCRDLHDEAVLLLGSDRGWNDATTKLLHSYDASLERGRPDLVVAPRDVDDLRALVVATYRCGVPLVMRGAGTGYSGGALPVHGGMVILAAGLNRIIDVDLDEG